MDSVYTILLGFALRLVVDSVGDSNVKVGGSLIGLWEGVVLYHFLRKMPRSYDPYVAYGFRLFIDFLYTESLAKLAIVLLWTGVGVAVSDVWPGLWKRSGLRRMYRKLWVRLPRMPFSSSKLAVAIPARRTVQFWDSPLTPTSGAPSETASEVTDNQPVLPVPPPRSRFVPRPLTPPRSPRPPMPLPRRSRKAPGAFPGVWSESETDGPSPRYTSTSVDYDSSDDGTAVPDRLSHLVDISSDDNIPGAAEIVARLMDADGVTVSPKTSGKTSRIGSMAPEDGFDIIETDEVQPDFDKVPSIPDRPDSTLVTPTAPPIPENSPFIPDPEVNASVIPPLDEADVPIEREGPNEPYVPDAWESIIVPNPKRASLALSDVTDMTDAASVLSGGRTALISRANLLRQEAEAEDKIRTHLEQQKKQLLADKDFKHAFLLQEQIEAAEVRANKLHQKAERRFFTGAFD